MAESASPAVPHADLSGRIARWRNRLVGSPRVQRRMLHLPLLRGVARRDGERLFDLMAGFVYAQTLAACVELGLLDQLDAGALPPETLAANLNLDAERTGVLCRAAAGIGLVECDRHGRLRLGRLGAEVVAVPGLKAMIRHHALLYRDLADVAAFLRGETAPSLAGFWPYVLGGGVGPEEAQAYSALMSETQGLVADEVLAVLRLDRTGHLVDVGGGTGAFLAAVGRRYPEMRLTLFDLPAVVATAPLGPIEVVAGDFRTEPLPGGATAISLVRVLFDHPDEIVTGLLARVAAALAPGGTVIVAEPMSGGGRPDRFGDTYFGLYTCAMGTGRVRSPARIGELLAAAGLLDAREVHTRRPFITRLVTARQCQ